MYVLFQSDEYITDVFILAGTTEWMGNHMDLKLRIPRVEMVLIIEKLLDDKALEEGEEYEYIPIESSKNVEPVLHFTPKKNEVPAAVGTLVGNIKKLPLDDLKQVLSTITNEMEDRKVPL